jgi:predicted regulator of Ras-like GTPase activity (Roadblock/LC7/MglB family)
VTAGPWADTLAVDAVDAADAGRPTFELGADEARAWQDITDETGTRLVPVLERLARALPSVTGVMVATADGFNLCALGLAADRVERVCAMTSALFSMATTALPDDDPGHADLLTIGTGEACTVVLAVPGLSLGAAILWVSAGHESLGSMVYRSRAALAEIAALGL